MALTTEQRARADRAFLCAFLGREESAPRYPSERCSIANAMVCLYADLMFLADRHGLDASTLISLGTHVYREELGDVEAEAVARIAAVDNAAANARNRNSCTARARSRREELDDARDLAAKPLEQGSYQPEDAIGPDEDRRLGIFWLMTPLNALTDANIHWKLQPGVTTYRPDRGVVGRPTARRSAPTPRRGTVVDIIFDNDL